MNGKSTVFFDSSNDGMNTTLNLSWPYTMVLVFNVMDTGNSNRRAISGSSNWLIGSWEGAISHHNNAGWISKTTATRETGRAYVAIATNDGSQSRFYVDGVDYTTNSSPIMNPGTINLGKEGFGSESLNGHIAEVMAYGQVLSEWDRIRVESYLAQKWSLGIANLAGSGVFALGGATSADGRAYLLSKMNLREASATEVTRALEATTPGTVNQFEPDFRIAPIGNPEKVNEFGIESARTGTWVAPNN